MTDYVIPGYVPNGTSDQYAWMEGFLNEEPWVDDALCAQMDPELWFPTVEKDTTTHRQAKAVCMRCEARPECLLYALKTRQKDGIWGGLSTPERKRIINRNPNIDELIA